ncbi:MAG: hypothetical protein PHT78_08940 [Desulfitobacteriaceae bacterium]|nr:hypothetical protein [Desulfitobacteriaceae bacterium]
MEGMNFLTAGYTKDIQKWIEEETVKWWENLKKYNEEINNELKEKWLNKLHINAEKFVQSCQKSGWIPNKNINIKQLNVIARLSDENPEFLETHIDEIFLTIFDEAALHDLLDEWSEKQWLKSRLPILKEVIESHLKGMYFTSVPAMLAQIEGIVYEGYGVHVETNFKKYEKKIKALLQETGRCIDDVFNLCTGEIICSMFLAGFYYFGQPIKFPFVSRHAVLHGSYTEYGTAADSLKCILLFDYLQAQFKYASIKDNNYYHNMDCPILKNTNGIRIIYPTLQLANDDGKTPCPTCVGGVAKN